MPKILIVEDDADLCALMQTVLVNRGYKTVTAPDGAAALKLLDQTHIDLVVSDIMMPGVDGYALLSAIRGANMRLPVLFVTAKGEYEDKAYGFSGGADDYMVKPINVKEMALRVEALLRRAKIASERRLAIGMATLDADALCVMRGEDVQVLPPKEFFLLFKLLSYPGRVFTRFEIMDEIWGYDSDSDEKTINVHISKLRARFGDYPEFKIVTVRGLGYKAVVK